MKSAVLLLPMALALLAACGPAASVTYYVDYGAGRDGNSGTAATAPFRHAPGDAAATAVAAKTRLMPGDRVQFRGGVPYRGAIRLRDSGTADKPIIWSGLGWGPGLAVFDGSDPVTNARPCRDSADCGGAPNWNQLTRVEYQPPKTKRIVLFGTKGLYWLSQIPDLPDPFYSDDRRNFAGLSKDQLPNLRQGILVAPDLARAVRAGGTTELAFWVMPNIVLRRPVLGTDGDRLRFDPEGLRFYTSHDGAVALNGSVLGLEKEGRYAVIAPGVMVAHLRAEDRKETLLVGSGRSAFNLAGQAHVTITGFHFRNMVASARGYGEGVAILAPGNGRPRAIEVSGSLFGPALLESGRGVVQLQRTDGFRFVANRVEEIAFGGGFRAAGGQPSALVIDGNVIRRVGRTAIGLLGVQGAEVKGNILADIRGVHGNALTAYLGNQDILFEGNCVVNARRPLTFEGDNKGLQPNRIRIRHNILISSVEGQAAINSWGAKTIDVVIEGNLLAGPKNNGAVGRNSGLHLSASDSGIVVRGNDTSGIAVPKSHGPDWTITDNREDLTLEAIGKGVFDEQGCSVPGTRIAPVKRLLFAEPPPQLQ